MEPSTNLAVAIASQLRDETHVVLADLNHLLTDVVLRAAGDRGASPSEAGEKRSTGIDSYEDRHIRICGDEHSKLQFSKSEKLTWLIVTQTELVG